MDNFHEFVMQLLLWKKGSSTHDHALLVTESMVFAVCARSDAGRGQTATAVVNVLQAAIDAGIDVKSAWIYTTGAPTWACKGMARLQTRGGCIFHPGSGGLACYAADRSNPGAVEKKNWGWAWSSKVSNWNDLAPAGTDTLATWAGKIKGKTRFRGRYVPVLELQDKCAVAATKVESLAVSTGRQGSTLTKFFDPSGIGTFDLVQQLKTPEEKDEFFSLLAQELVYRLRGRVERSVKDDQVGHNIGSVMVDSAWRVVGWSVNTNHLNGTFHGETNLVQANESHGQKALPKGGTMYTSLEPCEMCSGVIRTAVASGDTGFRVLYIQPDLTLGTTALKLVDSPVKMKASPAASTGGTIKKGVTFGDALTERQKALAQSDEGYLAPTRFLRHGNALQVFNLAGQQRATMSQAPSLDLARTNVHTQGVGVAALEQRSERQAIQRGLNVARPVEDIRRFSGTPTGIRDDSVLLDLRRKPLEPEIRRDDMFVGWTPPKRPEVDPVLRKLADDLDKLSVRFKRVFKEWFDANGQRQTTAEKARLLKQVTDFLDRARAACTR